MTNNRKIAILSYYHHPCNHPVLTNVFAKELAKTKKIVWFLRGDVSKGMIRRWHNSTVLLNKGYTKQNVASKIYNKLTSVCILFSLFNLLSKGKIKVVLLRDLPLTAIVLLPFRKCYDFKVYFQYSAPLGDISIAYFRSYQKMKRYWYLISGMCQKILAEIAVKHSNTVFPISAFHKNQLLHLTISEKLIPITMGVDKDMAFSKCYPIPYLDEIKRKYKLITYFGTLNLGRNPEFILEVFSKVKVRVPNCKLIIMGKTIHTWEDQLLREHCVRLGITSDVIFTGHLEKIALTNHLRRCDLSVSPIPPLKHFIISSPTKVYESLACGVPVIGNCEILEQANVIIESGGGLLSEYDTQSFSQAAIRLLENDERRESMGKSGREYVLKNYDYKKMAISLSRYF
jgi:glycosyltransferase involved in cell wall biosynthesis